MNAKQRRLARRHHPDWRRGLIKEPFEAPKLTHTVFVESYSWKWRPETVIVSPTFKRELEEYLARQRGIQQ